jgi:membrane protease YdiL (CAAX protease family)
VITGLIIGLVARKTRSLAVGLVVGALVGVALAFPIAYLNKYYWQVMLPGAVLGLIVGYATMRHGSAPALPAQ